MTQTTLLRELRLADDRMHQRERRVRDLVARLRDGDEAIAPNLTAAVALLDADVQRVRELTAQCRSAA